MSDAIVSSAFALGGTALGWILSEAGASWRARGERQRAERTARQERVFDAVRAAAALAAGLQSLIDIDVGKQRSGEGPSHETYGARVNMLDAHLGQLRQAPVLIEAKGPCAALAAVNELVEAAEALWDEFISVSRHAVRDDHVRLRERCRQLSAQAATCAGAPFE